MLDYCKIKLKIYYYLKAARLQFWTLSAALILLGEWLSIGNLLFYPTLIAFAAIAGLLCSGSFINHVFDKELDDASGKRKLGLTDFWNYVSVKEFIFLTLILSIISLALLWWISIPTFIIGCLILISIVTYSAPHLRLKGKPPFDLVTLALEFGTLPFFLGWLIQGEITELFFLYGFIFGIVIISVHLIFGVIIIDMKEEKKYGLKTSCVKLGYKGSINTGVILFFIILFLSTIFSGINSFITISLLICSPFFLSTKLWKEPAQVGLLISGSALLWQESIFFSIFILSKSIIPLTLFAITLILYIATTLLVLLKPKNRINVI